jgi:D-hydroxyproline dehydrogenase
MSNEGEKVRVIGAGIIGGAVASCLHRDRDEVFIADPNEPEHGASFGNAGVFGTSSVVPMSMSGAFARSRRGQQILTGAQAGQLLQN